MALDPRAHRPPADPNEDAGGFEYDGYDPPEVESDGKQLETPEGVSLVWTPKQVEWWHAVKSGLYSFMAMGGAIRGTKTFTVLMTVIKLMADFPRSRHVIVRKDLPVIRRNIVPPIEKLRAMTGNFLGQLNMTSWEYTATNGSKMLLVPESIKDDPGLEKFHGLEANTITLEEANEMSVAMKSKAIERAGSWIIPNDPEQSTAIARAVQRGMPMDQAIRKYGAKQCPPFVFFTFNPADNWVRDDIYDPYEAGQLEPPWFFAPATIYDNPFVTPAYLKSLEELKNQDPDAYDRFVLGIWGNIRVVNQLIDPEWLKLAKNVSHVPGEKRLGGDIARYGKDSTIWVDVDGNAVVEITEERGKGTVETGTTGTLKVRNQGIAAHNVTIDTGGIGGGTADVMRSNGIHVNEFVMGAKPMRRNIGERARGAYLVKQRSFYKYADLWSQAAWEAREKLRTGKVSLKARHPLLFRHLSSFRYEITNRVIKVWSSQTVRDELGFSPDVGVGTILGLFDYPQRDNRRLVPTVVIGGPKQPRDRSKQAQRARALRRGMRPR